MRTHLHPFKVSQYLLFISFVLYELFRAKMSESAEKPAQICITWSV